MFGVWGLGFGVWALGFGVYGLGTGVWVGGLYVHTLVKNVLIKFLMMLFLVTEGCKFNSCGVKALVIIVVDLIEGWLQLSQQLV